MLAMDGRTKSGRTAPAGNGVPCTERDTDAEREREREREREGERERETPAGSSASILAVVTPVSGSAVRMPTHTALWSLKRARETEGHRETERVGQH